MKLLILTFAMSLSTLTFAKDSPYKQFKEVNQVQAGTYQVGFYIDATKKKSWAIYRDPKTKTLYGIPVSKERK